MKEKIINLVALFVVGFVAGWMVNGWRLNAQIEATEAEHAQALQKAEQVARAKEQAWQAAHDALAKKYEKEKENAKTEINRLRGRISAGTVRLSVPARGCAVSENTGTGTGETRAELDPETANDLISIASDGDAAIRELNLCIDKYNELK
ncbi:lysis system i-spanin subunit Rz [Oxalobacter paraformigenes]|uniref:Lysis protein n=1 Tax=Oxalobacter paraformigenes TaxID=556268 RepID=C3X1V9_9BURK|nr:lysis system i-spanin subunit Rz [Oxalobacter paraformigenes]EEO27195.1 hypothetical protein OFAG_00348 [Oxalobacter paraformigenes]